ncbi:MAG TPA: hypothetical protein VK687_09940 [Bryobacteraceae bacterium]|nr:hypothetical protein [Bryobacteraceae bacterium]
MSFLIKRFERHSFWMILTASTILRWGQILASRPRPGRELNELEQVARSLALLGSFGNPYLHPTGPTAHVAPGIPLLLGMVYAIFGIGWQGELVERLLAALACSVQYALLPRVAVALGLRPLTGAVAGLLAALIPYKGFIETTDSPWEQPYVALVLVLLFLHTVKTWQHSGSVPSRDRQGAVIRGCLWGLATLISPMIGLVFAAVIFYEVFAMSRRAGAVAMLIAFAAIQGPWIARNWIQLHGLVLSRSNFGMEFRMSNAPESFALMEDNVAHGLLDRYHPAHSEAEWERVREMGEVTYNRDEMSLAEQEIRRDPGHFLGLTLERVWRFWLAPSRRLKSTLATTFVTLLGFAGLWMLPRGAGVKLVWLILLSYPLVYYLVQVDRRYRYPVEWIFIPPAVHAVGMIYRRATALPLNL